jgi:hypothetical protein
MHGCKGGSQHGGVRLLLSGRLLQSKAISKWLVAAPTGIQCGGGMEPCVSVWQLTTKSAASVIVAAVILNAVVAIVKVIGPASIFKFSKDAIVGFTKAAIVGITKAAIGGVDVIFKATWKVGFVLIFAAGPAPPLSQRLSLTRSVPGFDCTNALQQCIALLHSLAIIGGAEAADGFVLIFAAGREPPLWQRSSLSRNLPGFNCAGALESIARHGFCA